MLSVAEGSRLSPVAKPDHRLEKGDDGEHAERAALKPETRPVAAGGSGRRRRAPTRGVRDPRHRAQVAERLTLGGRRAFRATLPVDVLL